MARVYDFTSKPLLENVAVRQRHLDRENYTSVPAEIVSIEDYETLQCVGVKASITDVYVTRDNYVQESILLNKIFVRLPRAGDVKIKLPVAKGQPCILHFSHREIDGYLNGDGSAVELHANRSPENNDCWVELDGGTRKNHNSPSATDFIIEHKNTEFRITPDGNTSLTTSDSVTINCATANVNCSDSLNVTAPESTFNGNVAVTGTVTSQTGMFSPTYSGPSGSGGTMSIGSISAESSITINGKEINGHDHNNTVPDF